MDYQGSLSYLTVLMPLMMGIAPAGVLAAPEPRKNNLQALKKSCWLAVALAAVLSLTAAGSGAAGITPKALTLPTGYTNDAALAVNAGGQAFGYVAGENVEAACLWKTDGTPIVLPDIILPNGDHYHSVQANVINDSGVVVGFSEDSNYNWRATSWAPNADGSYTTAEDLGVLDGQTQSDVLAINAQGQILCRTGENVGTPYFLWENGVRTEITTPEGYQIDATGFGFVPGMLASNGRVAGTFYPQGEVSKAVLWQKTGNTVTVTDLGRLPRQ